ncbi:MAG TPA: hypothetical protein P5228_00600 [Bacteroidales bacterium]|nr:hypothetical protein [Bacteroidales bacterium]HRZ48322.1 hypothetical protein [Bacteroidales bacterium]
MQQYSEEGRTGDEFFGSEGPDPGKTEKKKPRVKAGVAQKIVRVFTNKYLLAFLAFLVWILFFDSNNLISRYRVKQELRHLERQKGYYEREITTNQQLRELLTNDLKSIEAFGREQYLMKRDNEDIYLIIDEEEE